MTIYERKCARFLLTKNVSERKFLEKKYEAKLWKMKCKISEKKLCRKFRFENVKKNHTYPRCIGNIVKTSGVNESQEF